MKSYEFYDKLLSHIEQLQTSLNRIRQLVEAKIKETAR